MNVTPAGTPATRRPLSAGELLDRSVSVVVRNWLGLTAMLAGVFVPLAICQTFSSSGAMLRALSAAILAGPRAGRAGAEIYAPLVNAHLNWFDAAQWTVMLVGLPIALAAVTILSSHAYDGETIPPFDALRAGVRRFFPILGLAVVWLLAVGAVTFVYIFIVTMSATFLIFVAAGGHAAPNALGIAVAIVLAIVAGLVAIVGGSLAFMIGNISFSAVILETANPFIAIGRSFARVLDRREIRRALLVSIALFVLLYVLAIFGWIVGGLAFALTHLFGLLVAGSQGGGIVGYAFCYTFVTFYYRDVRLRREGTDLLELAATPVETVSPA